MSKEQQTKQYIERVDNLRKKQEELKQQEAEERKRQEELKRQQEEERKSRG